MTDVPFTDAFWSPSLEEQIKSSFYYSPAWLDLITSLYGYRLVPLTVTNTTGHITGYLPLCSMQSPLTGAARLPTLSHRPARPGGIIP